MKRYFIIAILALFSMTAFAETLHVKSIHKATRDNEKTYRTSFNQNIIVGTIGNRQYTLEQLQSWGAYHFEVGQDYEVVKADDKTVKLKVADKKGKEHTESLNVVTVEETEAK